VNPVILSRLYSIVDVEVCARSGWAPRELARAHLSGGVRLLQLRAKTLDSGPFLELASAIADDARSAGATFIVNDRADLAVLSAAAGVHVGQDDLSPADVRRITGTAAVVGLSTHTDEQIASAIGAPISYLAIGPVFATATKSTGYEAVGEAAVRSAVAQGAAAGIPVVAIGGITLDTAARVIEAGAASVAVITDLVTSDPEARVRQYLSALA
jgi:thiamine-phosphate pyrophosphorylase